MDAILIEKALNRALDLISNEYQSISNDDLKIQYEEVIELLNEAIKSIKG